MEALIKQELVQLEGGKREVLEMKAESHSNPSSGGPLREVILTWKDTTKAIVNI